MDTARLVLDYIEALVWPIIIVGAVLVFRRRLVPLIGNIRRLALPWGTIELDPPREIREGRTMQATGEGPGGADLPARPSEAFSPAPGDNLSPQVARDDIYLVHSGRRLNIQAENGKYWYAVRVWLDYDNQALWDRCQRVTYKLHETFPNRFISTRQKAREFELWLRVWGEFTVFAYLEIEGESPVLLSRYLDLPGRPED